MSVLDFQAIDLADQLIERVRQQELSKAEIIRTDKAKLRGLGNIRAQERRNTYEREGRAARCSPHPI